jgi:hypothetical protein
MRAATAFALYIEVRELFEFTDSTECRTGLGGHLLMEVPGGASCGGTWMAKLRFK